MRLMNIQWIFLDIRIFLLGTHAIFKTLKFLDTALLFSLRLFLCVFAVFGDSRSTRTRMVGRCIMQYGNSIILCLQRSFVRKLDTSARDIRRDTRDI